VHFRKLRQLNFIKGIAAVNNLVMEAGMGERINTARIPCYKWIKKLGSGREDA
jgi:hypothetical protein